jgi:hypothetical protein
MDFAETLGETVEEFNKMRKLTDYEVEQIKESDVTEVVFTDSPYWNDEEKNNTTYIYKFDFTNLNKFLNDNYPHSILLPAKVNIFVNDLIFFNLKSFKKKIN